MRPTTPTLVVAFAVQAVVLAGLTLALLDVRAHRSPSGNDINQWGYRTGEAGLSKRPGEVRIAIVGGSAAFAVGSRFGGSVAGHLFIELRNTGAVARQEYSVVDLSEPQAGADAYVETLRDYMYLDPDILCVYDGYDVLGGTPPHARRRSLAYRLTGYLPVLPATWLGRAGWLSDPDLGVIDMLRDGQGGPADVSCGGASRSYCAAMADAVRFGLAQGRTVIVASPPSVSTRHLLQQRSLAMSLTREFGQNPRFAFVDLGRVVDVWNPVESPDGIHLTEAGAHVVGQNIGWRVLDLLGRPWGP